MDDGRGAGGGSDSMRTAIVTPPLQPAASLPLEQRWISTRATGSVELECVVPVLRPRRIKRNAGPTLMLSQVHEPEEDVENELSILRLERARVPIWSENCSDSKCGSQIEHMLWEPSTRHGETTRLDKVASTRLLSSPQAAQTMPSAESPPTSPTSTPSGSFDNPSGKLCGLKRAWPVIPR